MSEHAVVLALARTPIGRYGGTLAFARPDDLGALVIEAALTRSGAAAAEVDDVYLGCANQAGEDNRNIARMSALLAGLPVEVPGATVNRLCGSGMEAVAAAARAVRADEGQLFVAGGVESMSRAPWALAKPSRAFARGTAALEDTALGWRFVNPRMKAAGHTDPLGVTAENVAREHGIEREAQDRFAAASHRKALRAVEEGVFDDWLVPVPGASEKDEPVTRDESPRPGTTLERLGRLPPAFAAGGTVTAGNSSPLNDGAAALVLASESYARRDGHEIRARVLGSVACGVEPRVMGLGPIPATRKLLQRLDVTLDDLDVIELNEAFAAQALAVCRSWRMDPEDDRLNPNGGAIALGHPLGCSGARLVGEVVRELERRGGRLGLATMCIGVGQGIATVIERVDRP